MTKYNKTKGFGILELSLILIIIFVSFGSFFKAHYLYKEHVKDEILISKITNFLNETRLLALQKNIKIKIHVMPNTLKNLEALDFNGKIVNSLNLSMYLKNYQLNFNGFQQKNYILFSGPKNNNYSNGSLQITNKSSKKIYKIIINRTGVLTGKA